MKTFIAALLLAGLAVSLACTTRLGRVPPPATTPTDTVVRPRNEDSRGLKNEGTLRAHASEDTLVRQQKDAELTPSRVLVREDSSIRGKPDQYVGLARNETPIATGKREDFVRPRVSEEWRAAPDSVDRELQRRQDTTRESARNVRPSLTRNDQELRGRVVLQGPVRRVEPGRWVLEETKQPRTRLGFIIAVSDSAFALATARDTVVMAVASRIMHPTGPIEGIAVRQGPRLAYIAEEVRDRSSLRESDRFGFRLSQIVTNLGSPAYRSSSRTVYDVPIRVTHGQISAILQPGQADTLTIAGTRYLVRIDLSQYTVPGTGNVTFEESRHHYKYVIIVLS